MKETVGEGNTALKKGYSTLKSEDPDKTALEQAKKLSNTKAQGIMFWRTSLSSGASFRQVFAVIERGTLDVYKKEDDFINHNNPIIQKPIKLEEYTLVTDYRKFVNQTSAFSFAETMASSYDLKQAAKKFKFCLVPKVASELNVIGTVELMATDQEAYRLWTKAISTVIDALENVKSLTTDSSAQAKAAKITSVESVVEAAIKSQG